MAARLVALSLAAALILGCEPILGITDLTVDEVRSNVPDARPTADASDPPASAEPPPVDSGPVDAGHDADVASIDAGTDAAPVDYCARLRECCPLLPAGSRMSCDNCVQKNAQAECENLWKNLPQCH